MTESERNHRTDADMCIAEARRNLDGERTTDRATTLAALAIFHELRHQAEERAAHTIAMTRLANWLDEHSHAMNRLSRAIEQRGGPS